MHIHADKRQVEIRIYYQVYLQNLLLTHVLHMLQYIYCITKSTCTKSTKSAACTTPTIHLLLIPGTKVVGCTRLFAENLAKKQSQPTKKVFAVGKSGSAQVLASAYFDLIVPGLGCPWVGEFDGFTIKSILFPTQHNFGESRTP